MARAAQQAGFTLIELLVVLVIFGIVLGLVSARLLPDDAALARREAETTALLLERAADEAESTGRPLAWRTDGNTALFEESDGAGGWKLLGDDSDYHPRSLPGPLTWSAPDFRIADGKTAAAAGLPSAGNPAGSAGSPGTGAGGSAKHPLRLVFLPGQAAPDFRVDILGNQVDVALQGDGLGRVTVHGVDANGALMPRTTLP